VSLFPNAIVLEVDLNKKEISKKVIPSEVYRLYPGGSALAVYLILKEISPEIDPLGQDNILVFAVSPVTGLPVGGLSRIVVAAKSPLTGTIGDSQAGGTFPVELKANGYDAIIFKGKAVAPVYLYINGDEVSFKPADAIWGKVTGESEDYIRRELGDNKVEIAQIGPAGEKLVRYACIINNCNRANGRTGNGAVMGSKNLKAVVIKKAKKPKPASPAGFKSLTEGLKEKFNNHPAMVGLQLHGTDGELLDHHNNGFLPTKNISTGWFPEGAHLITGEAMTESILIGRETCYACPVKCKRVVEIYGKVDPRYGGPEYETCATLGSYCGVTSLDSIALSNQLCNMYGLDTISCGATISFAMECFEKGYLTIEDTNGIDLCFGNAEAVPEIVKLIAERKGIGDLLAEGSYRAAEIIGKDASELSMTVKGNEIPAHMPQYKPAVGLIYAVNPFGADHQSSEHDPMLLMAPDSQERRWLGEIGIWKGYDNQFILDDEKVRFAYYSQLFYSILDTLCLCQFVWGPSWQLYGPSDIVTLCRYGIGWETSLAELMQVGERRINMMKIFNYREGFRRDDDKLPKRFFKTLLDGPGAGTQLNEKIFMEAIDLYYAFAGWNKAGMPTPQRLKMLSLDWLVE
jgi:aldehyde:ferredoxin oxidoreductase